MQCIPGRLDIYQNEQLFCDCTDALDENGNQYVGKFCEHVSKENCGSDDQFCVNDGECNIQDPDVPCICPDDFVGPHCEFKKVDVGSCTLDCKNGGQCQFGIPPEVSKYYDLDNMFMTDNNSNEDMMYCICPDGFSGKTCESKATQCGNIVCYNGGICDTDESGGEYSLSCDCLMYFNKINILGHVFRASM
jgi:hypothetical protein